MRAFLLLAALAAAAAAARPAGAHPLDVYPDQYDLLARPGELPPRRLVLATTYGLVLSEDGGATWRWVCEANFGISPVDSWAPEYELTAAGTITATTPTGLQRSPDGCVWTPAGGMAGIDTAAATAIGPDGTLWLASTGFSTTIRHSTDDGMTWLDAASLGTDVTWVDSIAIAPTDAQRVYATGLQGIGAASEPRLWRSTNGGGAWTTLSTDAFTFTERSSFHVAAVDPADADLVFVRITDTGATREERLYRSLDGGDTWTEVFVIGEYITGVVVRASGHVLLSTLNRGVHRSTDRGATFTAIAGSPFKATCLVELPDAQLYICADNFTPDFMGLGRSTDASTWTRVMTMTDLLGPLACPAGTIQKDDCETNTWCFFKRMYGITTEEIACTTDLPDAGTTPPSDPEPCCSGGPATPSLLLVPVIAFLLRRRARPRSAGRVTRAMGGSGSFAAIENPT